MPRYLTEEEKEYIRQSEIQRIPRIEVRRKLNISYAVHEYWISTFYRRASWKIQCPLMKLEI